MDARVSLTCGLKVANEESSRSGDSSFSFENVKSKQERKASKSPIMRTTSSTMIQCDIGSSFFERLDFRKCLRCGLNDKIQAGSCLFHPAKCSNKAGAGNYLYSPEWHNCRENCEQQSSPACITQAQHYYGTHLPYMDTPKSPSLRLQVVTLIP